MLATTRRPRRGVTLMEVMIATAILAVGLMAIMALFPIGAVNFARAINQDRSATHGVNGDATFRFYWKKAWVQQEVRQVNLLPPRFELVPTGSMCATTEDAYANSQEPMLLMLGAHPTYGFMNDQSTQPSFPVLVDPVGWQNKAGDLLNQGYVAGNSNFPVRTTLRRAIFLPSSPSTGFPRPAPQPGVPLASWPYPKYPQAAPPAPPNYYNPNNYPDPYPSDIRATFRLATLLDDMSFDGSGEAAAPTLQLERGGRYTASWLIQRSRMNVATDVEVKVLVFGGRSPTDTPSPETAYAALAAPGTKTMQIALGGQGPPALRRGAWVAFWMRVPAPSTGGTAYPALDFYRVVGINDDTPDVLTLEVETPFKTYRDALPQGGPYTGAAIVFDNLLEVFDRGTVTPHATSIK